VDPHKVVLWIGVLKHPGKSSHDVVGGVSRRIVALQQCGELIKNWPGGVLLKLATDLFEVMIGGLGRAVRG